MTGSAATPQAMTLEEALMALSIEGYWLEWEETYWVVYRTDLDGQTRDVATATTWPETVSQALGYPVVARDDTAELVEALTAVLHGGVIDQRAALASVDLGAYEAALATLSKWKARSES